MLKIGVLASGRGTNLQSIINSIENGDLKAEIKVLISNNKGAKALERADRHKIVNYFLNPEDYSSRKDYDQALINLLEEEGAELIVLAGFMRLLSPFFVNYFKNRVMNIHPSLLPAFKGLHAQKQALEYGVKIAGCTVHFADEGMDTGPIILQASVPVKEDDTEETLAGRILEKEHIIYPRAIKLYSEGRFKVKNGRVEIADK